MTSRGKLAFMPFALHAAGGGQLNLTGQEKSGIKIKTPFATHFIGYYAVKLRWYFSANCTVNGLQ